MPTVSPTLISGLAEIGAIRARFPALARRHQGKPVAYVDGPGGTQVPGEVGVAMVDYLYHHNANTHWRYPTSQETDAMIAGARGALADFLGAAPEEVAFGANMTTLAFHLARALGRGWRAGDEVVITELDHHANVAPWRALERERGITIRMVPFTPESGQLDLAALEAAITQRTRLVALGAASNALGTISDVARAATLARDAGALTFVDAVHYAPHHSVDVGRLGCDFLACSAYKFYGPHIGVLYGRRDLMRALDVPRLDPAPDTVPERLETGTLNHEGIAGAAACVEFLASLAPGPTRRARLQAAMTGLHRRGQDLLRRLYQGLAGVRGVRLYGPSPDLPRTPTVAFTVPGLAAHDVSARLAEDAVFVSSGDFYAAGVAARYGLAREGLVRAGCACYTTAEEVDRLVDGVARLSSKP
jgi:cysteine desulfurase family protein (TIGR01976 family)